MILTFLSEVAIGFQNWKMQGGDVKHLETACQISTRQSIDRVVVGSVSSDDIELEHGLINAIDASYTCSRRSR